MVVKITELKVPMGMLFLAFVKSPDIFAPAITPVTAGKKTANTIQKEFPPEFASLDAEKFPNHSKL